MALWVYSARLGISLLLGALIGLERQFSRQMAGVRTNALICVGACLFCQLTFNANGQGDVYRIAAAVVTGIGFLGGGVIVRDGFTIKGLTTAATMWCTSAVGASIAIGYVFEALIATGLILLINLLLRPLSRKIRSWTAARPTSSAYQYHMVVACTAEMGGSIQAALAQIAGNSRLVIVSMDGMPPLQQDTVRFALLLQSDQADDREVSRVMAEMLGLSGVLSAAWDPVEEHE